MDRCLGPLAQNALLQKPVRFRSTEVSAGLERGMDPVSVSIATSFDYAVPIDTQVPLIAEAGFTHCSLGANESHSNYLTTDGQLHLKALAAQYGLAIDTIHSPRPDRPDGAAALSRAVAPLQSSECLSWSFTAAHSTFRKPS